MQLDDRPTVLHVHACPVAGAASGIFGVADIIKCSRLVIIRSVGNKDQPGSSKMHQRPDVSLMRRKGQTYVFVAIQLQLHFLLHSYLLASLVRHSSKLHITMHACHHHNFYKLQVHDASRLDE